MKAPNHRSVISNVDTAAGIIAAMNHGLTFSLCSLEVPEALPFLFLLSNLTCKLQLTMP